MEDKNNVNQEADALVESIKLIETSEDKAKVTDCKIESLVPTECLEDIPSPTSNTSRQSEKVLKSKDMSHLFKCGSFLPKSGAKAFKSPSLNYTACFSPQTIFEAMKARSNLQDKGSNLEYLQLRRSYVEWIFELAEKLKISDNSSHLAVLLMDRMYLKDNTHNGKLQLFAPACLLLAAKTIELDERIPFIPKLRRAANPTFSLDDFKKAEITLLEKVDWNPQFTSALEFLEFLVCQGSIYSSDSIEHEEEDHSAVLREKNQFHNRISEESTPSTSKDHLEKTWTPRSTSEPQQEEPNTTDPKNPDENDVPENDENKLETTEQALNPSTKSQQLDVETLNEGSKVPVNSNKRHPVLKTVLTVKVSSLKEEEILRIASNIERDIPKLAYLIGKESEFAQIEPIIIACACLAILRKTQKLEPAWNPELFELTKINHEEIQHCLELIESKIDIGRLVSRSDGLHNSENTTACIPLQEFNTNNEAPCQELKLFSKSNSASKPVPTQCENTDNIRQINLFSASNSYSLASDGPCSLSKDYSAPSRVEPSKYERSRYSTSRALASQNYPISTSQTHGYHRQNYHHHTTNYYPSQQNNNNTYNSNSSYGDRDYRSRNTMGSYQTTDSYSYKASGRSSYLRYDSTNTGTTYQPTSSYLNGASTGTASGTNPPRESQYERGSYIRHTDLFAGRNRGSGVLSARLNTSVDSGINLHSRLGFRKKE